MGKLKGSLCYLAGPIDYAEDLGVGWRQYITPKLRALGMYVLDPTNKPTAEKKLYENAENHAQRKAWKEAGEFEILHKTGKPVRSFDLRCTDKADCIVVYLDASIQMTGTLEELFTSNKDKKPVLVFCKQGRKAIADWIYWTIPPKYIFETIDDVLDYIKKIDSGAETDNSRWHFFDWDKIIKGD